MFTKYNNKRRHIVPRALSTFKTGKIVEGTLGRRLGIRRVLAQREFLATELRDDPT